jgi:hypothetical protein
MVDVTCDESESNGENLTDGNTDVFAHAGVRPPVEWAAARVREIRDRIRSPSEAYEANPARRLPDRDRPQNRLRRVARAR